MTDRSPKKRSPYFLWRDDQRRLCSDEQGVLPEGPWHAEPDRVDFVHAGLPCLLLRHDEGGHWCGYVALPEDHPWTRIDFGDLGAVSTSTSARSVAVHGGVTWSGGCDELRSCELGRRWLGFDCGHTGTADLVLSPRRHYEIFRRHQGAYRDLAYARRELEGLAEQVRASGALTKKGDA